MGMAISEEIKPFENREMRRKRVKRRCKRMRVARNKILIGDVVACFNLKKFIREFNRKKKQRS